MTNENLSELKPDEVDAEVWATHFLKKFPNGGYDKGDLLAWFAGMIMAGHDTATWREQKKTADARRAALLDVEKWVQWLPIDTMPQHRTKQQIMQWCRQQATATLESQRASEG